MIVAIQEQIEGVRPDLKGERCSLTQERCTEIITTFYEITEQRESINYRLFLLSLRTCKYDSAMVASQRLTNTQLALLELFSFEMSEAEVLAMRQTLMQHFRTRLEEEAQKAMQRKGLTTAQLEAQLNSDNRTEQLRQIRSGQ